MDRDNAPHGAELMQVAGEHLSDSAQESAGPDAEGVGVTPTGVTPTPTAAPYRPLGLPEPTVLTWQDLLDLPEQILPPETVYHLKSAGREALLAVYSLWRNVRKATSGPPEDKMRKHIEVE
jgi:hypothetical protein